MAAEDSGEFRTGITFPGKSKIQEDLQMDASSGMSMGFTIVWLVVLFGIMYFLMIRPQKKEKKKV